MPNICCRTGSIHLSRTKQLATTCWVIITPARRWSLTDEPRLVLEAATLHKRVFNSVSGLALLVALPLVMTHLVMTTHGRSNLGAVLLLTGMRIAGACSMSSRHPCSTAQQLCCAGLLFVFDITWPTLCCC